MRIQCSQSKQIYIKKKRTQHSNKRRVHDHDTTDQWCKEYPQSNSNQRQPVYNVLESGLIAASSIKRKQKNRNNAVEELINVLWSTHKTKGWVSDAQTTGAESTHCSTAVEREWCMNLVECTQSRLAAMYWSSNFLRSFEQSNFDPGSQL